ncbi:hypothetical protein PRZ48_002618 [Zasmidium cellare]|uniref:Altered inheritance of mitochondria protein 6 n=1 Tax=Zasmidium cellare TaxID=395010 RepID=A0ABR0ESZ3_ZASCE|nr:hypothetical protein PRZ48_002618 [Zasmidium cellare]
MASSTTAAAGASGTKSASANTFALDTRSSVETSTSSSVAAGPYRDSSFDDDEESHDYNQYAADRPRRGGFLSRILQAVGMRRRTSHAPVEYNDYFSTPRDQLPDGLLRHPKPGKHSRHSSPRELRRCRRGHVGAVVKRIVLLSPVAILAFFGVIHILHALIGRAGFFWDGSSIEDEFLPDWGKPGNAGEGLAEYPTDATRDVIPIACHSHNDYWRRIPFYDAIHWGCTGVEADVWLFDEELYVGHNTASLTKNRTFRNLYVNPILEMLAKMNPETEFTNASNTHGVFDTDPNQSLILLVDFKTSGAETYKYVHNQLSALREKDYLTYHDGTDLHQRPVTVVGTGNCPFDLITASKHRDIFFDAPLSQMGISTSKSTRRNQHNSAQGSSGTDSTSTFDSTNSYYASVSFTSSIGFVWRGQLSSKQLTTIRSQIKGAHERGLKVRYWDTPSWPRDLRNHVWRVLMREGADMLNVDDLRGAAVESWRARVHGFW